MFGQIKVGSGFSMEQNNTSVFTKPLPFFPKMIIMEWELKILRLLELTSQLRRQVLSRKDLGPILIWVVSLLCGNLSQLTHVGSKLCTPFILTFLVISGVMLGMKLICINSNKAEVFFPLVLQSLFEITVVLKGYIFIIYSHIYMLFKIIYMCTYTCEL